MMGTRGLTIKHLSTIHKVSTGPIQVFHPKYFSLLKWEMLNC